MVHLGVIQDQIVKLPRGEDLPYSGEKFPRHCALDGVHKGRFLIHNEKSVVGAPPLGGVTVKISQVPVYGPDPVDVFFYLESVHAISSFFSTLLR